jgi:uncharacterized protein (TIGR02453 family)
MLQPSTIQFLQQLKLNNNKPWFDANRKTYEAAKADYLQFVTQVLEKLQAKDASLANITAKDCVFRINRDVRFSKDKSPYKTNFGASFSKGGKKVMAAGYYFHCEPNSCFIGGGLWMPMAPELKKVRQEIDYCFDEFKKIVTHKKFVKTFGELSTQDDALLTRPPKGYTDDNPAIAYLKYKSFVATTPLANEVLTSKKLVQQVVDTFTVMQPLIQFLNRAIEM